MPEIKEWAIQDETTGEWWGCSSGVGWGNIIDAYRYSYPRAVSAMSEILRGSPNARIVPAPPREMTDAECLAWMQEKNTGKKKPYHPIYIAPHPGMFEIIQDIGDHETMLTPLAEAPLLFDAIRAARRKIEGGK